MIEVGTFPTSFVVLKSRFGARRVVLFGSLAHAAWFAPHSDVDLAVEGLVGELRLSNLQFPTSNL